MHKRKHFLKEVVWIAFILFLLAIVVRQGNRLIDTAFTRVAFPRNASIFENFKVYFTSVTILVITEYFIVFEYPNNYLLSRVIGTLVMMGITTLILTTYYLIGKRELNLIFLYLVYLIAIVIGQYISYLIQRRREYNFGLFLGLAQYLLVASIIIIFTSVAPRGFIFSWFR
ncbi:MAG: hypothetical protein M0R05_06275 [Bacilli bacterium]|nr:hypothetical protein [Bacilli bacterium]MDD4077238.1 hypothetical protein [Bacilli bacterium]